MTITTETLQRILAETKAATPGLRRQGSAEKYHVFVQHGGGMGAERVLCRMNQHFEHEADAAHIANCDPATVIAMVEELLRLRHGTFLQRLRPISDDMHRAEDGSIAYGLLCDLSRELRERAGPRGPFGHNEGE